MKLIRIITAWYCLRCLLFDVRLRSDWSWLLAEYKYCHYLKRWPHWAPEVSYWTSSLDLSCAVCKTFGGLVFGKWCYIILLGCFRLQTFYQTSTILFDYFTSMLYVQSFYWYLGADLSLAIINFSKCVQILNFDICHSKQKTFKT